MACVSTICATTEKEYGLVSRACDYWNVNYMIVRMTTSRSQNTGLISAYILDILNKVDVVGLLQIVKGQELISDEILNGRKWENENEDMTSLTKRIKLSKGNQTFVLSTSSALASMVVISLSAPWSLMDVAAWCRALLSPNGQSNNMRRQWWAGANSRNDPIWYPFKFTRHIHVGNIYRTL